MKASKENKHLIKKELKNIGLEVINFCDSKEKDIWKFTTSHYADICTYTIIDNEVFLVNGEEDIHTINKVIDIFNRLNVAL